MTKFSALSLIVVLFATSACRKTANRADQNGTIKKYECTTSGAPATGNVTCTVSVNVDVQPNSGAQPNTGNSTSAELKRTDKVRLVNGKIKAEEIMPACDAAMKKAEVSVNELVKAAKDYPEKRNFSNMTLQLETISADLSDEVSPLIFMGSVGLTKEVRDAGVECEEAVSSFGIGLWTRKDLYQAVAGIKTSNEQEQKLQHNTEVAFEKSGLKLSDSDLAQVKKLKEDLAGLESQFSKNLTVDSYVYFSEADLEGAPMDMFQDLQKDDKGRYKIPAKTLYYVAVMENAVKPETRKQMAKVYNSRAAPENVKLLANAAELRREIGKIMGYQTWAHFKMKDNMAQSPEKALELLNGLKAKLAEKTKSELQKFLDEKRKSYPEATKLDAWDISFYSNQIKKRDLNVNDELVKEYFPSHLVLKGLFQIYSTLLNVQFEEVKSDLIWNTDVKLYAIKDAAHPEQTLAFFYMDLIPREGKYSHAAAFPLISGRILPDGTYTLPVASIVANLNPGTGGKPALLTHDDVETLFHEFGHIMHQTLTTAPYASLSGSSVAGDFVEAPSQMLENWVWNKDMLNLISGHYSNESKKLPEELLNSLIASRQFGIGYRYSRQLIFGLTDLQIHTASGPVNPDEIYAAKFKELTGVDAQEGTSFMSTFGHMMGGYDAGYYGYIWSEVYAADMFTRFESTGLLDPVAGADYRRFILEPGQMVEPLDLVEKFLGRKSNSDAFFKKLGI